MPKSFIFAVNDVKKSIMKKWISILITGFLFMSFAPDKPAYKIFRADGKKVKYSKMAGQLEEADIVFFGELHNDPISHWLQLELTRELHSNLGDRLVLGAEMFESDNQLLLDEYLSGLIPLNKFEDDARLWDNYSTDYKPLLQFAREQDLPFIATNIPRRYANLVYREGFEGLDSLSGEGKALIAPIPIAYDPELPGYKAMLEMGGMGMEHAGENLPKSQAIKDATMAHFILRNWNPGNTFLHFNGAYHSDNHDGILWHILQQKQDAKIKTISTVLQESTDSLEEANFGKADFIIVVPSTMTKTY
jgi:uncharacterized iron-regulated protein